MIREAEGTGTPNLEPEDHKKQQRESVGALAEGIAHDVNNILSGILAHAEVALTELATGASPTQELQRIRSAAIRAAEILEQLMIYNGPEREESELVNVADVVNEMLELLRITVSKRVQVETGFANDVALVRASPTKIRQVAMNLITNASEAIGDRDGRIRVTTSQILSADLARETREDLAEGPYVQLEVSDTGRGMIPEVQALAFDPYFTTKSAGSHGQGLVVVKRIVQSLKGCIEVVSAPGQGSTFRVLLPADQNRTIPPATEYTFKPREATILLVDDEDLLRQALSKMLRKKGLTVIEAADAQGALEVIRSRQHHLDVLLLDLTLPGTSSREVYEETKRMRPGMAVIVASAKTEEMATETLSANIESFLRKPFRLADLLRALREALPRSGA